MESTLVNITAVSKHYAERTILDQVNFKLDAGERMAIVGPSGSGKSTLLNVLGLLDEQDEGTYQFDGQNIASMSEQGKAKLRGSSIGFIFQLHHLLPQLSVLENVTLPAHALATKPDWSEVKARGEELLQRVGLKEHRSKLPGQLSGGERQRAAVVRALINRPKLILADEPTGALDRTNADALTQLLMELNETDKASLVVVTHDLEIAKTVGPVSQIDNGRLKTIIT